MAEKNQYEDLVRFYEFQLGQMPHRSEFISALQSTFSKRDLQIFFLLPFLGMIPQEKFEKKAARVGIPAEELHTAVKRLAPEGMIDTYVAPEGRVYGRSPVIALLEFQVRLKEDSPMRAVCAKVMDAFIEGAVDVIPTKTPYYRVLPVESTLIGTEKDIPVNKAVPDPREVLPIDIVSEMVKKEKIIVVADCYCRSTKKLLGEDCGHPLETCFYFNELALVKLETKYARQIDADEAIHILHECEKAGLVHNVSNCEGKIQTLCNCCPCSCAVLKGVVRGQKNVGAPSRYHSILVEEKCTLCNKCVEVCPMGVFSIAGEKLVLQADRCIGCGHCVSVCQDEALYMTKRDKYPKIYSDNDALFRKINAEAFVGLALKKISGK
jgi:NAD-dependent dihydropyrimidine dehydrogenase PreA subunit/DNA-binding Lrp family transcriptional regulator